MKGVLKYDSLQKVMILRLFDQPFCFLPKLNITTVAGGLSRKIWKNLDKFCWQRGAKRGIQGLVPGEGSFASQFMGSLP